MKYTSTLITAAISGIMLGAGCSASTPEPEVPAAEPTATEADAADGAEPVQAEAEHPPDGTAAATEAPSAAKHDCKGKNDCKGQGGCKTDKNTCKGQNACKGQGGCHV